MPPLVFIIDRTAERIRHKNPELLEKQLADARAQLAQLQAYAAPPRAAEALKQATVTRESAMEATPSAVEQAQQELDDARSDQTSVRQEREHFEQQEKDALVQIDNEYSGITKATEVFQSFVRDDEVVPAWSGVELTKQDGNTARRDRNWQQTMWDLLS